MKFWDGPGRPDPNYQDFGVWRRWADGSWNHRPFLKRIINPVLRLLQRGPRPWVIASVCVMPTNGGLPHFLRYSFERVPRPRPGSLCSKSVGSTHGTGKI